jgi:hypothetical protein
MRASTNNRATTVLDVFLEAVERYGAPSRLRGDRGGENTKVSVWIILRRGSNRGSFMWGRFVSEHIQVPITSEIVSFNY